MFRIGQELIAVSDQLLAKKHSVQLPRVAMPPGGAWPPKLARSARPVVLFLSCAVSALRMATRLAERGKAGNTGKIPSVPGVQGCATKCMDGRGLGGRIGPASRGATFVRTRRAGAHQPQAGGAR